VLLLFLAQTLRLAAPTRDTHACYGDVEDQSEFGLRFGAFLTRS
jgi:hypothetical protein